MHVSYRAPISISITLLTVCVWFSPYATPLLTTVCFALSAQFDLCLFGFCFVYCALCAVVPLYFQHTNKNIIQKKIQTIIYIFICIEKISVIWKTQNLFEMNEKKETTTFVFVIIWYLETIGWNKTNFFLYAFENKNIFPFCCCFFCS